MTSKSVTPRGVKSRLALSILPVLAEFPTKTKSRGPAESRPCLLCGKPKRHNNSFCSADHARLWKEGYREVPTVSSPEQGQIRSGDNSGELGEATHE